MSYIKIDKQNDLLREFIDNCLNDFIDKCRNIGISEEIVRSQVDKEYNYIISGNMTAYYYLIGKAVKQAGVDKNDIFYSGTMDLAVIPNMLGITGTCVDEKLKHVFASEKLYLPEVYYGVAGCLKDSNPSSFAIDSKVFSRFIETLNSLLVQYVKEDIDLTDFEVRKEYCVYVHEVESSYNLGRNELVTGLKAEDIPLDDEKTIELFREGSIILEPYGVINSPIEEGKINDMIKRIVPYTYEDIMFAVGLYFCSKYGISEQYRSDYDRFLAATSGVDPITGERKRVFREDYLKPIILEGSIERFNKQRKICIKEQIFSRAHVENYIRLRYQLAYYWIHYPETYPDKMN